MDNVAKKPESLVLPVTPEWQRRVLEQIDKGGWGEKARLARAVHCSTGTLSELLKPSETPNAVRYSRYVEPINRHYKWPSMMPLSPDTAEIQHIIKGLSAKQLQLIKELEGEPDSLVDAMLVIVRNRNKPSV